MMGRRSRRRKRQPAVLAAVGVLLVGALATASFNSANRGDEGSPGSCDAYPDSPTVAIVVDASDKIAPKSANSVREAVARVIPKQRGARVVVARISGAADYRPEILFDRCDPGGSADAQGGEGWATRAQIREEHFLRPLRQAIDGLLKPIADSDESYIADTIARVAADPAMHLHNPGSVLLFGSDMIEHTVASQPYETGRIVLPPVSEPFLSGIALEVIELPAMPGAAMLQNHDMRSRWRAWFIDAGATSVRLSFPGLVPS